jgi:hypothetical protein
VARPVLLTPPSMTDARRAVSRPRAAIADRGVASLCPLARSCGNATWKRARRNFALGFKHKRCNLPSTYANGIGLQTKTLMCRTRRRQADKPFDAFNAWRACYALRGVRVFEPGTMSVPGSRYCAVRCAHDRRVIGMVCGACPPPHPVACFTLVRPASYNAN